MKTQQSDDIVGDIIRFEMGEMSEDEVIQLFQRLVDSRLAWQLQGSYGRMAERLITAGLVTVACAMPEQGLTDAEMEKLEEHAILIRAYANQLRLTKTRGGGRAAVRFIETELRDVREVLGWEV